MCCELNLSDSVIPAVIVRLPDTNFHKKTAYHEYFMKRSWIEGNYMASISQGVPTYLATIFKMASIFFKWPPFFEVRTLKMIEITDFNDLSVDSNVLDNSKSEYQVFNFESPTWRPTVAISKMATIMF